MTGLRTAGGMLDACFLGPYGENDVLLEKLVVEFLRDHVYWRRNFHPEDPPAIPTDAAFDPGHLHHAGFLGMGMQFRPLGPHPRCHRRGLRPLHDRRAGRHRG